MLGPPEQGFAEDWYGGVSYSISEITNISMAHQLLLGHLRPRPAHPRFQASRNGFYTRRM